MQIDNSADYYRKREQHALGLARCAVDDYIRAIHNQMAAEYGRRASAPGSHADARERVATG